MPIVPFQEWAPDAADFGNPGSIRIVNALPGVTSYKPIGALQALTDAIDERPRGAIEADDGDGNAFQYVGDKEKLYRLVSDEWEDASKSGGYSTGSEERWEFVRWKDKVLATNFNDSPQEISLGGTEFDDLTTDFRCRHLAVVRDFVVAANTFDGVDGLRTDRIRWSAFNDETDWTVSPSTGADFRDLKTGGAIQAVIGGEFGIIISEQSTWRMSFVGSPVFFQIDEVLPGTGALAPGGVARLGETVYFLSPRGIVALQGATGVTWPGAGKVDEFVLRDIDDSHLHRISSTTDPASGRIFWAYPGAGNTEGRPNRILVYDGKVDKWALLEVDVELVWRAGGLGLTLEQLDDVSSSIDDLPASLDSNRWKGTKPLLAAFGPDFTHGFFDGSPLTATLDTREMEISQSQRTLLNAFRPLVDGGEITARVGTRNRQSDDFSFGPTIHQTSSGRFTTRDNARFHRFRIEVSGNWRDAIGVQVDRHDARPAGRRG